MDYSIIEFLPVGMDGALVKAEIIGTNLYNYAWPLLRYRTRDLVLYDPNERCKAGTPGQVIRQVYGRTGQYFILPNGSKVTNITVIARKCHNIRFMQVVQKQLGELIVRIVKAKNYSTKDEQEVEEQFHRKIGDELKIRFEYVDEVERTAAGKYMAIINRLGSK